MALDFLFENAWKRPKNIQNDCTDCKRGNVPIEMLLKLFISSGVMEQQSDTDLLWQVRMAPALAKHPCIYSIRFDPPRFGSIPGAIVFSFVAMVTRQPGSLKTFYKHSASALALLESGVCVRDVIPLLIAIDSETSGSHGTPSPIVPLFLCQDDTSPPLRTAYQSLLLPGTLHFPLAGSLPLRQSIGGWVSQSMSLLFVFYYAKVLFRMSFQVSIVCIYTEKKLQDKCVSRMNSSEITRLLYGI